MENLNIILYPNFQYEFQKETVKEKHVIYIDLYLNVYII